MEYVTTYRAYGRQIDYAYEVRRNDGSAEVMSEYTYRQDKDALDMARRVFGPMVTAAYASGDVFNDGSQSVAFDDVILQFGDSFVIVTGSDDDGARFSKIEVEMLEDLKLAA